MKKFLTMTFVFALASTSSVLGATQNCGNVVSSCQVVKVVDCNTFVKPSNNCNVIIKNDCFKPDNGNNDIVIPEEGNETPDFDVILPDVEETPDLDEDVNESVQDFILPIEREVVELVNKERAKYGLSPLEIDFEVSHVARLKSQDMASLNYFSHTSPTYGSPFDMLAKFNINYRSAGENIAMGQKTAEAVVNAWMNSEGHRANILNSSYTHIGVGYVLSGNTPYWTQTFIGK